MIVDNCVLTVNGTYPSIVELPAGTRLIAGGAFSGCTRMTSVTIPDGVTSIGENAFEGCSGLTSVTIPSSVTSIGNGVFYRCSGLTSVTIPDGVTNIGSSAFYSCKALSSVTIPEGVTSIGESAFYGCSTLTSVTIPSTVTSIGAYAFRFCVALTSVTIPPSVTSIGAYAFDGCGRLSGVTIANSGGTVSVPKTWKRDFAGYEEKFGTDLVASLMKPTGKHDGAGNALLVWQDYVTGTDPTDENDVFSVSVTMVDGQPVVSYSPELSAEETALRQYVTWGKVSLQDKDWVMVTPGEEGQYNFFKVSVEMK